MFSTAKRLSHVTWKELIISDVYGVTISASWQAMTQSFKKYGIFLTEKQIAQSIASSKKEHISNLVYKHLQIHDCAVQNTFITLILKDFTEFQLQWFKDNPESYKVIDLVAMQTKQEKKDEQAIVLTSMFPDPVMDFLKSKFKEQGFYPNAIYNTSPEYPTRSSLVQKAMNRFPAQKTSFLVDTVADAKEIADHFSGKVDVIGVLGHSAELPDNLASRFIQEANAKEVIHSFRWK